MGKRGAIIGTLSTAATAAAGMHIFNLVYNYQASSKHVLSRDAENFYEWKGVKVYFERKGSGSPLILLHSLHPAVCSYEWHNVIDILAADHTVYSVDLPGCGRSSKPNVLFTNFYYVSFLRDFIKAMGIQRPALAAANSSAAIALMTAVYEKDLVDRLILVNPSAVSSMALSPSRGSRFIYHFLRQPFIGTFIYSVGSCRMQVDHTVLERYFYNPFHATDELVDAFTEAAHLESGRGHFFAAALYGRFINMNLSHALREVPVPVKLIEGRSSENAEKTVEEWTALCPDIEVCYIDHSRNLPMLEEPDKTAAEIILFLN